MFRRTDHTEINLLAQHIHATFGWNDACGDYPVDYRDLAPTTTLHLQKTAYVFLTGDFNFVGPDSNLIW